MSPALAGGFLTTAPPGKSWNFFFFSLFFWLHWVFVAARGLSLAVASGGYSLLWCTGFSLRWFLLLGAWALGAWASVVVAHGLSSCGSQALERSLSCCGAWAQLLCSTWDLPGPGIEPVSPVLAGRFLTTVPPGKSLETFKMLILNSFRCRFLGCEFCFVYCRGDFYVYAWWFLIMSSPPAEWMFHIPWVGKLTL